MLLSLFSQLHRLYNVEGDYGIRFHTKYTYTKYAILFKKAVHLFIYTYEVNKT
jgi:hypothetical protein